MSGDLEAVQRALVWQAEDLGFHRPDVVLAFIDTGSVRLDRWGGPIGARDAVLRLAKDQPYLVGHTPQGADAGLGTGPDAIPPAPDHYGPSAVIRAAAGARPLPRGPR